MQMQNTTQVSDFPLAVTLATLGFQLLEVDRTNPGRVQFCFKLDTKMEETVQAFWRGELRLEPKALFLNHKSLKSRLYSQL